MRTVPVRGSTVCSCADDGRGRSTVEDSSMTDPLVSQENSPRASAVKPPSRPQSQSQPQSQSHPQPQAPAPFLPPISTGVAILSPVDLAEVRRAIGAPPSRFEQPSTESSARIPKGVPDGLYKKTLERRREAQFSYYFTATLCKSVRVRPLACASSVSPEI